jgi:SAM-dependent methyltransferase
LAVRRELAARAQAMVARWCDDLDVVDLASPGVLDDALMAVADGRSPFQGEVGAIVSVGALSAAADLHRAVQGVARLLGPDGQLVLAEPVGTPGWRGVLSGSIGSLWPVARSTHLQRDVPFTVRRSGFEVTDIDRFTLSTRVWPLRHGVVLRARASKPLPDNVRWVSEGATT